jgi:hypothetical protein
VPEQRVAFGTSGHRGSSFDDAFNEWHILAISPAICVDVWINTSRRPWEACGTSGIKVLVNGGINLSELNGWWQKSTRLKSDERWGMAGSMVTIPLGAPSKPTRSTACSSER